MLVQQLVMARFITWAQSARRRPVHIRFGSAASCRTQPTSLNGSHVQLLVWLLNLQRRLKGRPGDPPGTWPSGTTT